MYNIFLNQTSPSILPCIAAVRLILFFNLFDFYEDIYNKFSQKCKRFKFEVAFLPNE